MRIVFMGTPDFAVPSLKSLINAGHEIVGVVTQPDKPKGRKQELTKSPVKIFAESMGIEIFQPDKIRDKDAIQHVLNWNPDIIVTAAYGQIIPVEILEAPKYKAVNVHASLLPKYRGAAPIHQSIIKGEKETGITIMYMVKELDAGDILSQAKVPIEATDNVGTLHDKLSIVGAKLLVETLEAIANDTIIPIKQDELLVTFARTLKRDDELINWDMTNIQVYDQIRGLNPWPVAFTYFRGEVFKIWWATPVNYNHQKEPGTIIEADKDQLIVAAAEGAIKLEKVQPAGKKKMDISSFLNGTTITIGEKMGE